MNYLFHLFLAEPEPASLLGGLMGDFVKGPLVPTLEPGLRDGIILHRRTDSFAHTNAHTRRSKVRLDPAFGHCRAVMVDIFYDHFLALRWDAFAPMPLDEFAGRVYRLLEENHAQLPPGLQRIAPRMIRDNWLESYREPSTVDLVLQRLAARLSRPTPLARGGSELRRHYAGLEEDFSAFVPEAKDFAARIKASPPSCPADTPRRSP